jgi:hypothetical protein
MKFVADWLAAGRRPMACATVLVLIQLASGCSSDSPEPVAPTGLTATAGEAVQSSAAGAVVLRSRLAPEKCLTISGTDPDKGTPAELRPCAGGVDQQFTFTGDEIRFGAEYCVDAESGFGRMGDAVIIGPCHKGSNQKWSLTDAGEIRGINNLCVDVWLGDARDGQPIVVWSCHGGSNQRWDVVPVDASEDPPPPVAEVGVTLSAGAVAVGGTAQAAATLRDAAGNELSGRAVAWASSAPGVASVSAAGLVTGLAAGTASITATSEGRSGAAALTVTAVVAAPPPGGGACRLVTDLVPRAPAPLAKPGYLGAATDPAFGTTLVRVSGDPGAALGGGVAGSWPGVAGPAYAKRQPWSADGAYLMLDVAGALGGGVSLLVDGATYRVLGRAGPAPSYVWHPTAPDVLIGVTGGGSVVTHDVRTGAGATRVAVRGYTAGWLGKGEGNPSNDGRYVPVSATRAADGRAVVFVADAAAGTKSADLDVAAQGFSALDWVGVSQTGRYVVLFGTLGGVWGRAKVYDRATLAPVHYWADHPTGHADLGVDAAGDDVLFGGAASGPYARRFIARRLADGRVTPLTAAVSYDWHASARNTARPGWGYVVTNDAAGSALDRSVYAVALDGSGRVERLAHHRSAITDYEAHPFAVPSPDGRRVLMRSNWGAASGRPVQGYVVDARPLCP